MNRWPNHSDFKRFATQLPPLSRWCISFFLCVKQAEAGRDAFAKHIYSRLFNWVVAHMNKKLIPERQPHRFIGVLDIYGYDTNLLGYLTLCWSSSECACWHLRRCLFFGLIQFYGVWCTRFCICGSAQRNRVVSEIAQWKWRKVV